MKTSDSLRKQCKFVPFAVSSCAALLVAACIGCGDQKSRAPVGDPPPAVDPATVTSDADPASAGSEAAPGAPE